VGAISNQRFLSTGGYLRRAKWSRRVTGPFLFPNARIAITSDLVQRKITFRMIRHDGCLN
jgi:hypothetical protein